MRERTPSADDTPTRAPPAPPREAAPVDVAGSQTSTGASVRAFLESRMVASSHSLEELGVTHPASASSERQQQDKQGQHSVAYKSGQTAQDKRSRLSNVINNLRKKVPENRTSERRTEEDERNSVERNLETLEKYVMTVLNGVIKDEEENRMEDHPMTKDPLDKGLSKDDPRDVRKDESKSGMNFEPSEPCESQMEAAVPVGHDLDVAQDDLDLAKIQKEDPNDLTIHVNFKDLQEKRALAAPASLSKDEVLDHVEMITSGTKCIPSEEEASNSMGYLENVDPVEGIDDRSRDERDHEGLELRTICRDLLNDLLNDINQLIDENAAEDAEDNESLDSACEDSFIGSEHSESSRTSLHCSLPLDKVASILQNCQSDQSTSLKSPTTTTTTTTTTKPPSPTVRHLCLYCDRKFLSISLRQRHTERVHQLGGGRRSERNSRKPSQNCQYCSDRCADSLDGLFQHMVGSHGDKYHACLRCNTRYLTRDALITHTNDNHGTITERIQQVDKIKELSSFKEMVQHPRDRSTEIKEPTSAKDESETKSENNIIKQTGATMLIATVANTCKDTLSNPGSPEFDSSFYSSVSCNIRDNLLHHIDGKLQTSIAGPATPEVKQSLYEHNVNQIQFPIDISLTAATPVYSKEYNSEDYENSSEYAQKPGKTRTHPRRVSFEKYNFPRKYDGKEQWTCSIKDLSKFDISTQLSLRKKQQLIKERLTINRLNQITLMNPSKTEVGQTDMVNPQCPQADSTPGDSNNSDHLSQSKTDKIHSINDNEDNDQSKSEFSSKWSTVQYPGSSMSSTSKSTEFSIEFGNFMRLRKWEDNTTESNKNEDMVYAELTGEWSRPRIYICGACATRHVTLKEMEEHKASSHPNVWCSHFEFSGDQRELYKHLFLPGRSVATVKARNAFLSEKVCTKCAKNCNTLPELHRHMLECGGDQAWLQGLFGNGKKKCKWRPFGSRSRRRRQRGMKRNIQNSQTPRVNMPKERPPSGPRVRPSDRESIQKMLANLPPKRASRKVLQDTMTRSQGTLRNVQTRSRPRLTGDSSPASALSRNKAALKNKLLKNAKSFQRNRCRIDNIAAAIESVVKDYSTGEDENEKEDVEEEADDEDEISTNTARDKSDPRSEARQSRSRVRGVRVVSKKRNVRTKEIRRNVESSKTRETRVRSRLGGKSVANGRTSVSGESASVFGTGTPAKGNPKSVKTYGKSDKSVEIKLNTVDSAEDGQNARNESLTSSSISRRKKSVDPTASLNASIKARSQLRTHDGKFARNPNKKTASHVKKPIDTSTSQINVRPRRNVADQLLTRSKVKVTRGAKRASRRTTRLSSDSDKMPTLEPVADPESTEEDAEESGNELPILTPVASVSDERNLAPFRSSVSSRSDSGKKGVRYRSKHSKGMDSNEVLKKNFTDLVLTKNKPEQRDGGRKSGRGRWKKRIPVIRKESKNVDLKEVAKVEDNEDDTSLTDCSIEGTRQFRTRNRKNRTVEKPVIGYEYLTERRRSSKESKTHNRNFEISKRNVKDEIRVPRTRQDRRTNSPDSSIRILDVSPEVRRLLDPAVKEDLLAKLGLNLKDSQTKRNLRTGQKSRTTPTRIKGQKDSTPDESIIDSDPEKSSDSVKITQSKREKFHTLRKSPRNIDRKTPGIGRETPKPDVPEENESLEIARKDQDSPTVVKDASERISDKDQEVLITELKDDDELSSRTKNALILDEQSNSDAIEETMPHKCLPDRTEVPNPKSPKRSSSLGKRRGRIKSTALESDDLTDNSTTQEDSMEADDQSTSSLMNDEHQETDSKDVDVVESFKLVTADLVNISLEHLQQESSNSNVDSGKENSSETPVNVPKVKTVRPKKTKGARRDRVVKRTLSNVIGILTEGVNIPVEAQQSVVLTVQTSLDSNNPEAVQSSDEQTNENNVIPSGPLNPDRGDKTNGNSDIGLDVAASSGASSASSASETVTNIENQVKQESVSSSGVSSGTDVSLSVQFTSANSQDPHNNVDPHKDKVEETSTDHPTNDIILDLSRRKPKGKGSFLEKIVSKIAKQKDALLDGEVGSLLDSAADELTSILGEVSPGLTEISNPIVDEFDVEKNEEQKEFSAATRCKDQDAEKKLSESECLISSVGNTDNLEVASSTSFIIDVTMVQDIAKDDTKESKDDDDPLEKAKRKSMKRSLEVNSPKKNKRKSVEEEVEEEFNEEEELCLADIMKLIQKPKESEDTMEDAEDSQDGDEYVNEKIRPGKRKVLEDDEEEETIVENESVDNVLIDIIELNGSLSECDAVEERKKFRNRKSSRRRSLAEEPEDPNVNTEKKSEESDERVHQASSSKISGKRKSITDHDVERDSKDIEESIASCDSSTIRLSKRRSVLGESMGIGSEGEKSKIECQKLLDNENTGNDTEICYENIFKIVEPSKSKEIYKSLDVNEKETTDVPDGHISSITCLLESSKIISQSLDEQKDVNVDWERRKVDEDDFKINLDNVKIMELQSTSLNFEKSTKRCSKRKSLADEHLELPISPGANQILESPKKPFADSPEDAKFIEEFESPSKKKSFNINSLADDSPKEDITTCTSKTRQRSELPTGSLEPFKVPEVSEVLQHTKKRSSKRKSLADVALSFSEDQPLSESQNSPLTVSQASLENSKNREDKEIFKNLNDNGQSLKIPERDNEDVSKEPEATSSTRRRSFKRKNTGSNPSDYPESLSQRDQSPIGATDRTNNSHGSEAGYSMRKRSSKRKYLMDDLEDFSDDIYTDNSITDNNSIDADKSGSFERRQTPKRKAKKNIPLIDEHLDLCDDLDIPDDSTSEVIFHEKTIGTNKIEESSKNERTSDPEDGVNSNKEKSSNDVADDDNENCQISKDGNTEIPDTEDPTKEDFQAPKKRGTGNFAIVHTKSGEILIVEKKKKLTKEAAKFFCDVCATSFTRKSSLKKHNLSQSHLVQMVMAGKDQGKDNVDLNDDDSLNTSGFPGDSLDENDSSKNSDAEMADENSNDEDEEEEQLNEFDEVTKKLTRDNFASLEYQDLDDPPKSSLTPQMSEEEALEEELLDEEICKITENMSHDEYVLTDHISPVLPEASSTPVTVSLKKTHQKTRKAKRDQEKKRNLAEEHLDLDSPTPIKHSNLSSGSFKDVGVKKKIIDEKIVEFDVYENKDTSQSSEIRVSQGEIKNLEKLDNTKNHIEPSLKNLKDSKCQERGEDSNEIRETFEKDFTKLEDIEDTEILYDESLRKKSKTNFSDVSLSMFSESKVKIQKEKGSSSQEPPVGVSAPEDTIKTGTSLFQESGKISEQEGSSSSSFADKPLSEFLTKNVEKSDRRSSRKGMESRLNFSNIAVKLRAQETSTTGTLTVRKQETKNSLATEFDSDENSIDTRMSIDIKKVLNDPELGADDRQTTSQDQIETKLGTNLRISSKCNWVREESLNAKRTKMNAAPCSTDADTSDSDSYTGSKKAKLEEDKAIGEKALKNHKTPRESNRKNRMIRTKSRRQYSSVPAGDSSDSDEMDEDRIESRNKNKIVKSVFGRVFAGEKVDKVKEVLDDWDSRSELEDSQDKESVVVLSENENENGSENANAASILAPEVDSKTASCRNKINKSRSYTVSDMDSTSGTRSSLETNKRNRSGNAKERRDGSLSDDRTKNDSSSRGAAKSRPSLENRKRPEVRNNLSISSADVVPPSSRCRQSKKRAEERISRAFEEESTDFRRSSDRERSRRSRDHSYGLKNQSKLSSAISKESVNSRSIRDEEQDSLDLLESSDPETEVSSKTATRVSTSSTNRTKKKDNEDWEDFTDEKHVASVTLEKLLAGKNVDSDSEDNVSKPFQKAVELKSRDFIVRSPRSPRSPGQSSLAPSSIRNRSPTPDRNSQSSQDEDQEDEVVMTRGRISPLFVLTSPETSMDSASICNEISVNQEVTTSRKRSTSEFSGDKVVIRSPLSNNENTPEMVTIAPTDAVEDNALDVPQETLPQKSRQGKVLNFDEELFVECCSRLKATTENELRGAKKIKLDHSDGFHKKEDPSAFRSSRDRWRDVESQNSLGSLLESVNQLLGEEIYNTREKEYTKRARTLRSDNSSRSVSPDAEVSRPDNLGYEDSLDVAFEHNNKLRDKIQQRMRESENLLASTFGQRNSEIEFSHKRVEGQDHEDGGTYGNTEERGDASNLISNGECLRELSDDREEPGNPNDQNVKDIPLDSSGFKNKMNSALGGLLDKALSNLLHSNEKHDHNGSTPMKVLAELACARAPTSTNAETPQDIRKVSYNARESIVDPSLNALKDPLAKKIRNPIKELFERKKEINERRHNEKTKAEAALKELNAQRQQRTKKTRRRQEEFPLVRKGPHGGLVERKKRRDIFSKKDHSVDNEKIKDVYDFDEEESQMETGFGNVMPYRSKIEKSYEISCLRTKDVDVAGLMSKAIDETLENGMESDVLGRRLESMIDKKFKEIEKFAPKTKGALKSFQADVKQGVTGPMDDYVERHRQRQKKPTEQTAKQPKIRKKNKSPKKKSRNAWYENDSSDEFRTAAKTEDVGVGITKSQRTCSKGKQNLFAELSTSSESEYEENDVDYETKRRQVGKTVKKIIEDPVENDERFDEKSLICIEENNETRTAELNRDRNDFSMTSQKVRTDSETKKSESEMSEHPLVIDERKESDEQRNSDDDGDTPYDRSFELDDLYREDSSVSESDNEQPNTLEQNVRDNRSETDLAFQDKSSSATITKNKYLKENELIPLEEALDLLDHPEDLKAISEKPMEKVTVDCRLQETTSGTELIEEMSEPIVESQRNENDEEEEVEHQEVEINDLPEKLSTNEKPEKESENLPLHVFLSRKVQESKKRKQQQLRKLQEEQERILMDFQPTRRQRKCAIGKQGLLAEISSSDEESYARETYRRFTEKSEQDRSRKPKRESKEKRKERYMEKKHEQMIAKEQKAIEEEILREVEKKKETFPKDNLDSDKDTLYREESLNRNDQEECEPSPATKNKMNHRKRQTKQKQRRPNDESQDNDQEDPDKTFSELDTNCDKVNAENDFDYTKQKKQTRSPAKSRKTTKSDGKTSNGSRKSRNSNSDRSKKRSISAHSKDPKDRRASCAKWDSDDEELRTTKSWNKVEEGVGVAIGRRKRAAANQLYYWSSSSDEEELIETAPTVEEEDDRQEQHGWIVGDSHKRMITMLAMEKQLKEKRRRSEDEFESGKTKKKHRNSTS